MDISYIYEWVKQNTKKNPEKKEISGWIYKETKSQWIFRLKKKKEARCLFLNLSSHRNKSKWSPENLFYNFSENWNYLND